MFKWDMGCLRRKPIYLIQYIDVRQYVIYNKHIDNHRYDVIILENKYEKSAKVFKAFYTPNRLMIIEMLLNGARENGFSIMLVKDFIVVTERRKIQCA